MGASICVVAASGGYPGAFERDKAISGIADAEAIPGVKVFHAGTRRDEQGRLLTAGGRVLGVSALAGNLGAAMQLAYAAVEKIRFPGMHYRRDIGGKAKSSDEL